MALIITVKLLVDEVDPQHAIDGLNDMLRTAQAPVDPADPHLYPWLVDWHYLDEQPAGPTLTASLRDGTYHPSLFQPTE